MCVCVVLQVDGNKRKNKSISTFRADDGMKRGKVGGAFFGCSQVDLLATTWCCHLLFVVVLCMGEWIGTTLADLRAVAAKNNTRPTVYTSHSAGFAGGRIRYSTFLFSFFWIFLWDWESMHYGKGPGHLPFHFVFFVFVLLGNFKREKKRWCANWIWEKMVFWLVVSAFPFAPTRNLTSSVRWCVTFNTM